MWCSRDPSSYFAQVQQLLDAMQLSQYKEAFRRERVDGELLLEMNDNDLQADLGVQSRLHRIRLLKVAQGLQSVDEFQLQ